MPNEEEIKLLKAEVELLKEVIKEEQAKRAILEKDLIENKKNDDKRHRELKEIQKTHHGENLHWNKIGVIATPITSTLILPLIMAWFMKKKEEPQYKSIREDKNKQNCKENDISKKLDQIIKLLEEQKLKDN